MNPSQKERDEKIVASITNPDSMLLGPALLSDVALEYLIERLSKDQNNLAPKAIGKSLFYIVKTAKPEVAAKIVTPIASSKEVTPRVRQYAIDVLGLLPSKFADEPLATALTQDKDIKESIVLKAMAQAGSVDSLQALKSLAPASNAQSMKLRAYAETMIALRLGERISIETETLTLPKAQAFKFGEENIDTLKNTISSIEGKPFNMSLNEEFGFSFDCGNCKHTILFNSDFKRGRYVKSLSQAQIVGMIVMNDKASGRNVVRYSIVTQPSKNAMRISVLRTNGDIALSGDLRPEGDNFSLFLRDLGTEVRPIQVSGRLNNDEIELTAEIFDSVSKTKLTGISLN